MAQTGCRGHYCLLNPYLRLRVTNDFRLYNIPSAAAYSPHTRQELRHIPAAAFLSLPPAGRRCRGAIYPGGIAVSAEQENITSKVPSSL